MVDLFTASALPARPARNVEVPREELNDWNVPVSSSLQNAVPAYLDRTVITLHKHQIIVERQDSLYRALSVVENILVITSSLFFISVSATSVFFAVTVLSTQ
jgi:hypothetical protein